MGEDRSKLTIRLTDDALAGWDGERHRANVPNLTALLEVLGLALHDRRWHLPPDVVEDAKTIAAERLSRRRRG